MRRKMVEISLKIEPELDQLLLQWRRRQPDLPNRSAAIRTLLRRALGAAGREQNENG